MMKFKKLKVVTIAGFGAILLTAHQASATLIDFEDLIIAVGTQLSPASGVGVTSRGFNYTPGPNNASGLNDLHISNQENFWSFNGTTIGGTHDDVVLTDATGATFSLQQFDFAGFPTNAEIGFSVIGALFGGGNVLMNFFPDGITDGGPAGAVDFQTFVLGPGFTNLTSVTWVHSGAGTIQGLFALDNIFVNEVRVPEPGTIAMLGLGLAGLGFARRKRAA